MAQLWSDQIFCSAAWNTAVLQGLSQSANQTSISMIWSLYCIHSPGLRSACMKDNDVIMRCHHDVIMTSSLRRCRRVIITVQHVLLQKSMFASRPCWFCVHATRAGGISVPCGTHLFRQLVSHACAEPILANDRFGSGNKKGVFPHRHSVNRGD